MDLYIIRALTRENLSSGAANNKNADRPAQFDQHFCNSLLESIISRLAISKFQVSS